VVGIDAELFILDISSVLEEAAPRAKATTALNGRAFIRFHQDYEGALKRMRAFERYQCQWPHTTHKATLARAIARGHTKDF
jgi:hypothetical protein